MEGLDEGTQEWDVPSVFLTLCEVCPATLCHIADLALDPRIDLLRHIITNQQPLSLTQKVSQYSSHCRMGMGEWARGET